MPPVTTVHMNVSHVRPVSGSQIAGMVVGVATGVSVVASLIAVLIYRRRSKSCLYENSCLRAYFVLFHFLR